MPPRDVLRLEQAARPAAGAAGTVELERVAQAPVAAHALADGVILLDAGHAHLLADLEELPHIVGQLAGQQVAHHLLVQRLGLHTPLAQPGAQLLHAVGVVEMGQRLGPVVEPLEVALVGSDGPLHQRQVDGQPALVDGAVQHPELPLAVYHAPGLSVWRRFISHLLAASFG